MKNAWLPLIRIQFILSCSGGGSSDTAGGGDTNKFTMSGSDITIDGITSSASGLSVQPMSTSQTYYGRFFSTDGINYFAGSVHFTLNKNDNSSAYFSNFYLDRMVQLTGYTTNTVIVSSSTNLLAPGAYNATTNSLQIQNAATRYIGFKIDFGNNTYLADVPNALVLFSRDFSTMIGGDNATFFFIAQKASSLPPASISDLTTTWKYINFSISLGPVITLGNTGVVTVGGIGGHGLSAFNGSTNGTSFQGEVGLNDSTSGISIYGYDSGAHNPPMADGTADGGFLLSPDKNYFLGFSFSARSYFGGSR